MGTCLAKRKLAVAVTAGTLYCPGVGSLTAGEQWNVAYRETCEATQRGEQSEQLLDVRMLCLRHRLDEAAALADLVAGSMTRQAMERAQDAASALSRIEDCADAWS